MRNRNPFTLSFWFQLAAGERHRIVSRDVVVTIRSATERQGGAKIARALAHFWDLILGRPPVGDPFQFGYDLSPIPPAKDEMLEPEEAARLFQHLAAPRSAYLTPTVERSEPVQDSEPKEAEKEK